MQIMFNEKMIDDDDLVLAWRDIQGLERAHIVMLDACDFTMAVCGREFPSKDIIDGPDENQRCKFCTRCKRKST